jgi:hypothetical protein
MNSLFLPIFDLIRLKEYELHQSRVVWHHLWDLYKNKVLNSVENGICQNHGNLLNQRLTLYRSRFSLCLYRGFRCFCIQIVGLWMEPNPQFGLHPQCIYMDICIEVFDMYNMPRTGRTVLRGLMGILKGFHACYFYYRVQDHWGAAMHKRILNEILQQWLYFGIPFF